MCIYHFYQTEVFVKGAQVMTIAPFQITLSVLKSHAVFANSYVFA